MVFRRQSIPGVRQSDARFSTEFVLAHLLGVSGALRDDRKLVCTRFTACTIIILPRLIGFDGFQTVFIFFVIKYEPVKYGSHYTYPWWGEGLGIAISLMSMIWIPLYAAYYLITEPGTLKQVGIH